VAGATAPRAVVAGWSAAVLLGVPPTFIDGFDGNGDPMPICVNPRTELYQRQGIRYSFSTLTDEDVSERHGILVTTGVRTAFDAIRLAPTRAKALAWGDACVRFGLAAPEEIAHYASGCKGWPGIRRVRELTGMLTAMANRRGKAS